VRYSGERQKFAAAMKEKFGDEANASLAALPDLTKPLREAKLRIEGEGAFMEGSTPPGEAPEKDFVKAEGSWKVFLPPVKDAEKPMFEIMTKLADAMATVTPNIAGGQYATAADAAKAVSDAAGLPTQ
jgi:hypothetical protein